jgi:hypothetical protein
MRERLKIYAAKVSGKGMGRKVGFHSFNPPENVQPPVLCH